MSIRCYGSSSNTSLLPWCVYLVTWTMLQRIIYKNGQKTSSCIRLVARWGFHCSSDKTLQTFLELGTSVVWNRQKQIRVTLPFALCSKDTFFFILYAEYINVSKFKYVFRSCCNIGLRSCSICLSVGLEDHQYLFSGGGHSPILCWILRGESGPRLM